MLESASLPHGAAYKHIAAYVAAAALGVGLSGYAVHEHHSAQDMAAKNQQAAATLKQQRQELMDLTSKVNVLVAREQTPPEAPAQPAATGTRTRPNAAHLRREDPHWKKLQTQLDAQGKAIEETRTQLAGTQGDLNNTRTELTGSIAHTHDELVLLQKHGERNYTEFDLSKSREFARTGPFSVKLRKANEKHQYADLDLIVDDRTLTQKHVNLYQPVMFSTPDSPQPVQVVINQIGKNHIHGYISAPKYRQSELASMAPASQNGAQDPDSGTVQVAPPALQQRQRLTVPQ
jgi:hypothetical protein